MSRRPPPVLGAALIVLATLPIVEAQEDPLDVLVEVRLPEPQRGEPRVPPLPWFIDPVDSSKSGARQRGIPLPEMEIDQNGARTIVYKSVLYPASEKRLTEKRPIVPLCPAPLEADAPLPEREPCIVALHANPRLVWQEVTNPGPCRLPTSGGNLDALLTRVGAAEVAAHATGKGVVIALLDVAMNATYIESTRHVRLDPGFSLSLDGVPIGEGPRESHGTMTAFLSTVLAPEATLASISLDPFPVARLAGAIEGLDHLITHYQSLAQKPAGVVVNNSWSLAPESYTSPGGQCLGAAPRGGRAVIPADADCHAFNRTLTVATSEGFRFDVVFAAGNGGRCVFRGGTIGGPSLRPEVLTVAAVDTRDRRLFDSGQGAEDGDKPDISGYSHFQASGTLPVDDQTSAATALVSGLVAAVRACVGPKAEPAMVRGSIMDNSKKTVSLASSMSGQSTQLRGHSRDFGAGVIDARAAVKAACPPH